MKRFERLTSILLALQTRRVVRGHELAERFGVSVRTVYRDVRALEAAGLPLIGSPGIGYSLVEGYRLAPVTFTRDEAAALLAAEKLAARLTDPETARHALSAMDKVRSVLTPTERDYVEDAGVLVEVIGTDLFGTEASGAPTGLYRDLLAAVGARQVVRLTYRSGGTRAEEPRDVEPIGLYFERRWYLAAFCRRSRSTRTFRLDRVASAEALPETYVPLFETLQQYLDEQSARRRALLTARVRFSPEAARRVQDSKRHYGWTGEVTTDDGDTEMTFVPTTTLYLATWLLPQDVRVVSPPALTACLRDLAVQVHARFVAPPQ